MRTVPLTYPVHFGHNASVMFPEANLPVWARLLREAPMAKAGWYFSPLLAASFASPKSPGEAEGGGRPDRSFRLGPRSGERDEGDSSEGLTELQLTEDCFKSLSGTTREQYVGVSGRSCQVGKS